MKVPGLGVSYDQQAQCVCMSVFEYAHVLSIGLKTGLKGQDSHASENTQNSSRSGVSERMSGYGSFQNTVCISSQN